MRLKDKVVIVTGAAQGIGAAYAERLANEGACVVAADILECTSVCARIEAAGGTALPAKVDVSNKDSCAALAARTVEAYGRIDVLLSNAAMFASIQRKVVAELTVDEWDKVMAVNVRGPFLMAQAVLPSMRAQGRGKIVNISSATVFSGTPGMLHYVTSKAAVVGLTRSLAREIGKDNIQVNSLAPGLTMSDGLLAQEDVIAPYSKIALSSRSIQRDQLPEDLLGAMLFLCSSDSDFTTGQTLVVDGGYVMH